MQAVQRDEESVGGWREVSDWRGGGGYPVLFCSKNINLSSILTKSPVFRVVQIVDNILRHENCIQNKEQTSYSSGNESVEFYLKNPGV